MAAKPMDVDKQFIEDMEFYRKGAKGLDIIENSSMNPSYFAEHMIGIRPFAWQVYVMEIFRRSVEDRAKYMNINISTADHLKDGPLKLDVADREIAVMCSRQIGKMQPLSEPILTPDGWRKMGDIEVGDFVYSRDGQPTEVTGVFPQENETVYKITFTDGSSTRCGADHLWKVKKTSSNKEWKVVSTKEMLEDPMHGPNPISDRAYRIPLTKPVIFDENTHVISPYTLGVLLGDGSITSKGISLESMDDYIVSKSFLGLDYYENVHKTKQSNAYRLRGESRKLYSKELNRLGLLDTYSDSKFIPDEYLLDSVENRLELLRGLMDTDGSIYGKCVMEYSTSSPKLRDGIKFLVESLGGNVKIKSRMGAYTLNGVRKEAKTSYRVYVRIQTFNPFSLPRKADKWYKIKYYPYRIIKSIERVEDEKSQCISVANKDHTYLTKDFIVTHNTTSMCIMGLWATFFNKAPAKPFWNTVMNIVSSTEGQATDVITEMKNYIRMGDYKMSEYKDKDGKSIFGSEFFSSRLAKDKNNATFITWEPHRKEYGDFILGGKFTPTRNGSFIKSVPPTQKILGNSPTIGYIDEAGRSKSISDNFINSMFKPAGSRTNALWVYTSTPWAPNGMFYEAMDPDDTYNTDREFVKIIFTVDAIAIEDEDIYKKNLQDIAKLNARGKLDDVQRSFYCKFVKGEDSFFDPDKVKVCFDPTLEKVQSYSKPCNIGIDFGGQTTSKTVVTVTTVDDDGNIIRLYERNYPPQKDEPMINDVKELMKDFAIDRIIVDDCPAGQVYIRMMEQEGWELVRMSFRAEKVKKYGAFRRMLNKGKVKSYNDEDLRTEMLAMEYSGNTRQSYIQHAPGYSDDLIDSFVMSTYFYCEDELDEKPKFFAWG